MSSINNTHNAEKFENSDQPVDQPVDQPEKAGLTEKLIEAIYQNSTVTVFFHTAIAEQVGLGATEEKTLLILSGSGSLTAGEIAQQTGLATASVTSLIDRLEKKGFVHRVRDAEDRRRVSVELDRPKFNELMQIFESLGSSYSGLLDGFSETQLQTILEFVTRSTQFTQKVLDKLKTKES